MSKQKQFKKQFLYRDDQRIESSISDYQRSLDRVSGMFPKVEKVIKRELTDEEKIALAHDKANLVIEILKPQFPFPNADDEFNLQALGLNIAPLLNELMNLPGIFCKCEVENKRLIIGQTTLDEIEAVNTQYTENENQNKALALANRLIAGFEEAAAMNLVDAYGINKISQITKLLHNPIGSGNKILPNRYTIKDIM